MNTLKLYTTLRVDVDEQGTDHGVMELPDPDAFMDGPARERFSTYHKAILEHFAAASPEKDLTSLFRSDFNSLDAFQDMANKISSLRLSVEDADGKFFGTVVYQLNEALDETELFILKEYSRGLFDSGLGDRMLQCRASPSHGTLDVHIWRSKSGFMLTEKQMEQAPWRKQNQPKRGGDTR